MRLGIIGGTFDPVHQGHIHLALDAKKQASLDEVWFMPAKLQPFKLGVPVTAPEHRLAMLELACEGHPGLAVSTLEMEMEGPNYTYLTLDAVRERFRGKGEEVELYFIVGTDTFVKLSFWKNAEHLLSDNAFILAARPGYEDEDTEACKAAYERDFGTEVIAIENEPFDLSSTEIREKVLRGESIEGDVPAAVAAYIDAHGLYRAKTREEITAYVREQLPDRRWNHTLGVMESAVSLAKRYGADPDKAELAALCHDMCKKWPDDQMNLFIREHGMDPKLIDHNNLSHSKAAEVVARERLGIRDEDILNAISYHTTGRAGMSLLEKIIFLADSIEPARDFPEVAKLRELAYEDIDKACLFSLERTRQYVLDRGMELDEDTDRAAEWFRQLVKDPA